MSLPGQNEMDTSYYQKAADDCVTQHRTLGIPDNAVWNPQLSKIADC